MFLEHRGYDKAEDGSGKVDESMFVISRFGKL